MLIKKIFGARKKNAKKLEQYSFVDSIMDNLECDCEFQNKYCLPNYQKIYEEMKKKVGLENVEIEFKVDGGSDGEPYTKFYKEDNDSFIRHIELHMRNDSQEHCYRASLRHELEHVITGIQLMDLIGLEKFVDLQRGGNSESLAYRTIAEYLSWKAACEEDESEENSQSLSSLWEIYKDNMIKFCDGFAAHIAYETVHGDSNYYKEIFWIDNQDSFLEIAKLIKEGANKWPMTISEFAEIGESMKKFLAKIKMREFYYAW